MATTFEVLFDVVNGLSDATKTFSVFTSVSIRSPRLQHRPVLFSTLIYTAIIIETENVT